MSRMVVSSKFTVYFGLIPELKVSVYDVKSVTASVPPLRLQEQTWLGKTCAQRLACGYSGRMRVRLLYFGVLREMAGGPGEMAELPEGATVGELSGILRGREGTR